MRSRLVRGELVGDRDHERLVLLESSKPRVVAGMVSFVGEVQVFQKRTKSGDSGAEAFRLIRSMNADETGLASVVD
jgi:hypothetical protein